jgi:glycosyltransferase involved in cell wall biosynthesis
LKPEISPSGDLHNKSDRADSLVEGPEIDSRDFRAPPAPHALASGPKPTFSVIIAAHNAAGTIADALDSALTQTLPPHEIIVCDDGSTDDTTRVLKSYHDRIVHFRQKQAGPASARNAALRVASGDFFAVLDADDAYLPGRLEALADLAVGRPDLDILCTDAILEVEDRVLGRFEETCRFEVVDQRAAILQRCFCAWPAVRRTKLTEVGGFDESQATGSDWECAIRLVHAGALAGFVGEPLYRYRVHSESLTADRVRTLRDRVEMLERVGRSYPLTDHERDVLSRYLRLQRSALVLTEAEAALRSRSRDARPRALAAARARSLPLRSRVAALGAALAPRIAAHALQERGLGGGRSRLSRSVPDR